MTEVWEQAHVELCALLYRQHQDNVKCKIDTGWIHAGKRMTHLWVSCRQVQNPVHHIAKSIPIETHKHNTTAI